jgi:hypothetical protein
MELFSLFFRIHKHRENCACSGVMEGMGIAWCGFFVKLIATKLCNTRNYLMCRKSVQFFRRANFEDISSQLYDESL